MMPKLLDGEQLWLALDTNHGAVMDHCEALRLRTEDAVERAQKAEAANATLSAQLAVATGALVLWRDLVDAFEVYGVDLPTQGEATAYVGGRPVQDAIDATKQALAAIAGEGEGA